MHLRSAAANARNCVGDLAFVMAVGIVGILEVELSGLKSYRERVSYRAAKTMVSREAC